MTARELESNASVLIIAGSESSKSLKEIEAALRFHVITIN